MKAPVSRTIVLAGGGVTGIAWEIGLIAGLVQRGITVANGCRFIGTSAGSVVCAELAHGVPIDVLLMRQRQPGAISEERYQPYSQREIDRKNQALMEKTGGDLTKARQKIGAFALRSVTPSLDDRRAIIRSRLSTEVWPESMLQLTAVDAQTGELVVLDAQCGLDLVDAVMASCAVPGVWPTVPYREGQLMDGGLRSMANADLAHTSSHVLILAPLGYSDTNPVSGHLRAEIRSLEQAGIKVDTVVPDTRSQQAIGDNVLDPAGRQPSADAGLAQGLLLAQALDPAWQA